MYAPGSFTRNFAWHGRGLRKLHEAVRAGFSGRALPTDRDQWRAASGIEDRDLSLLPVNFYLNNRGSDAFPDELVLRALGEGHSRDWDRLALFALNLSNVGTPSAAETRPIRWANEFVRERLFRDDSWDATALQVNELDAFIADRVSGSLDGRQKIRRNYRHLWELCGYLPAPLSFINSGASRWLASALFLTWDRTFPDGGPRGELADALRDQEIHKLLGVAQQDLAATVPDLISLYLSLGGVARFEIATKLPATALPELTGNESTADEIVGRALRTREEQLRNQSIAIRLKEQYKDQCCYCGVRLEVGNGRFYSEAAHIKPLGRPHNGPDHQSNMIVLCPNHHKQFDRGVIWISRVGESLRWHTAFANAVHPMEISHQLDAECIDWHARWCAGLIDA